MAETCGEWVRAVEVDEHGSVLETRVSVHSLGEVTQWRVGPDGFMFALTLPAHPWRALPNPEFAEP